MPKVSVIVPTFNSASYIKDALLSVLAQSCQDLEIIVVDDASTDNTAEVVNSLNSKKINYICLPKNHGGPSKARNIGIENAKGEYIALFDSDDLMLPDRIESAVSAMDEYPELGMVCTDALKFDAINGDYAYNHLNSRHYSRFRSLEKRSVGNDFYVIDKKHAYACLFYENFVQTSSVTIRKKIFAEVGCFDESLVSAEDCDLWFRIMDCYDVGYVDAVCIKYRMRPGSITTRPAGALGIDKIKVLQKRIDLNMADDLREQAATLSSIIYADMGYSFQCANQMKLAREHYLMSLKEKFSRGAFLQLLITLFDLSTINTLKKSSVLRKCKEIVIPRRDYA